MQRFYFDTSVFGGAFDKEFDEATLQLFKRVRLGKVICVFSDLTETELLNAPENVKEHFKNLPKHHIEKVIVTDEILTLATKYVAEKVEDKQVLTIAYTLLLLQFTRLIF